MKADLKCKMSFVPLLAFSALAWADAADPLDLHYTLDPIHVAAPAHPVWRQIDALLEDVHADPASPRFAALSSLVADRLALIALLAAEGQAVFVRQHGAAQAAILPAANRADIITTHLIRPGQSLIVQQNSGSGFTYLHIQSSGSTAITSLRRGF